MNYIKNSKGRIEVIRHGEVIFFPVDKLPIGLKKARTDVIMRGSGNNPHTVVNADLYFKKEDDFVFGYLKAKKGTKLYHKEHGLKKVNGLMEAPLKAGCYQLRVQNEKTHQGLKVVTD